MQEQLGSEAEADEDTFKKAECWCKENTEEKNKIIADSEQTIELQTSAVEENAALGKRLVPELKKLKQEIFANEATLEKARVLREDQVKSFTEDEKKMTENLEIVSQAEAALASPSLLQAPQGQDTMERLKQTVKDNFDMIKSMTSRADRMLLDDFLKGAGQKAMQGAGFLQKDGQESGGLSDSVVGLLRQMKENFAKQLKEAQQQDLELQESYELLVAAKRKEIAAGVEQNKTKTLLKAEAAEKVVSAKQDIKGAEASKEEAQTFLQTAAKQCAESKAEYEDRLKMRLEEQQAVSKAIEILDADEAHAVFSRAVSFLQETSSSREQRASEVLTSAGRRSGNEALVALGLEAKLGGFTKVKKAIDNMVQALEQEQKDEIAQHDECISDLNKNEASTEMQRESKKALEGQSLELSGDVSVKQEEIAKIKEEVAEMQKQLQVAKENYEKETKELQAAVQDQRQTQALLNKARQALTNFYGKEELSLVEVHSHVQELPSEAKNKPPGFGGEYDKNSKGGGIVELLRQIQEDAKRIEVESEEALKDSAKAFQELSEKTQEGINRKTKVIGSKASRKANLASELSQTKQSLRASKDDLANLEKFAYALHQQCDFIMENFKIRQAARDDELRALAEAQVILSS
eukprot:TRINITY_DN36146_c0_g1_i1.p1 TRINITY_DN36146_c0_g1~~TRINITY_DN36146_c0_g1_i1.p1  ORF type:complete len:716 (+),score=271.47 TRINITY_DN36146_c0_g1_i1:238-2148(+)